MLVHDWRWERQELIMPGRSGIALVEPLSHEALYFLACVYFHLLVLI
jgi:hypothetical protein